MDFDKCCLCLDKSKDYVEILSDIGSSKNIGDIIKQHFWFLNKIHENDFYLKRICLSCWLNTSSFHQFFMRVKHLQEKSLCKDQDETILKNETQSEQQTEIIKEDKDIAIETIVNIEKVDSPEDESDDELPLSNVFAKEPIITETPKRKSERIKLKVNRFVETELITEDECREEEIEDDDMDEEDNDSKTHEEEINETEIESESDVEKQSTKSKSKETINKQIRQFFNMYCDLCESENFKTFSELKAHYLQQHDIAKGYLTCCKRKLKSIATAKEHMIWHSNPELFTCKVCQKTFVNKIGLTYHMLNHEPETNKPHKCDICSKSFAKYYQMNQHKISHTYSSMDKKFKCETCGNGFPTQSHLRTHTRVVHDGIYAHVCDICARVFKSKLIFDRHQNEHHLGIKPQKIQCQLCGAWIKNESYLRKHMKRHKEESKDFICKFCGKRSPSREALRSHERYVHISERKYKCTYCEKAFRKPKELREHMAVHTGDVLYQCLFCPKTFNSNANMYSHQSKVHRTEWIEYKTRENIS